tara:strand:+ start:1551 stop:2468 length:918 start_codon:yes stop_codon:yes gene_type:complete
MPSVTILLCTYNGGIYLEEQLNSIVNQTYKNWNIIVSDDCSEDNTLDILNKFQKLLGKDKMTIMQGPQQGFSMNFLSLISKQNLNSNFFAFSDQDDIWEPEKLSRGLDYIQIQDQSKTALYCSRTKLIDKKSSSLGFSPLFKREPSFHNALVQSLAGGNTMIINKKTLELMKLIGLKKIVSHDWLIYQIVTGTNGFIKYDSWPSVMYRQHDKNKIGNNMTLSARIVRLYRFLKGDLRRWITSNIAALRTIENYLTDESRIIISELEKLRKNSWIKNLVIIKNIKFYRQTFIGNVALYIGFLIKKI